MNVTSLRTSLQSILNTARGYLSNRPWTPTYETVDARMSTLLLSSSDLPAFLAGAEYALDLVAYLSRDSSGLTLPMNDTHSVGTSVRAEEPSTAPYRSDLTALASNVVGDPVADYTSATLLAEALRLYWNKYLLQQVQNYLRHGSRDATLDGVRKEIRRTIPTAGSRDAKRGYSPSSCDLSGNKLLLVDGVIRVNTTITCYGGVKIPISFEVSVNG